VASPDTDELATVPLPEGTNGTPGRTEGGQAGRSEAGPAAAEAETETAPQERVDPERIEPDGTAPESAPARPRGRWWRGFTGSLAAGLTVLAVGVLVVGVICLFTGAPGPGAASLIGHPVAAGLALVAQRVADRRRGWAAAGGGVAVVLFAVSAATIFWFS
jgi:predicted lipid-binding transport protein (Tim44 family)